MLSLATNGDPCWGPAGGKLAEVLRSYVAPAGGTKGHSGGTGSARDSNGFFEGSSFLNSSLRLLPAQAIWRHRASRGGPQGRGL